MVLVKAKLETITTANSFNTDVQNVYRTKTTPLNQTSTPAIFVNEERQRVDQGGELVNNGLQVCTLPISVECWLKDDSSEKGTQVNAFLEDVVKAVFENPQWNDGSNNLAVDTNWLGDEPLLEFSSSKGFSYIGIIALFEIQYRHKVGDLTSLT